MPYIFKVTDLNTTKTKTGLLEYLQGYIHHFLEFRMSPMFGKHIKDYMFFITMKAHLEEKIIDKLHYITNIETTCSLIAKSNVKICTPDYLLFHAVL